MPILPPSPGTGSLLGLHLFHFGPSSCSQRVRIGLAEMGLKYQSHVIDLWARQQRSAEYLLINPRGLVPTLVHDGSAVIESLDILIYLDTALGSVPTASLSHPDPMFALADEVQDALRTLSHEFLFRSYKILDRAALEALLRDTDDPEMRRFLTSYVDSGEDWWRRVEAGLSAMRGALATLEAASSSSRSFGLSDMAWFPTLHRLATMGWPLDDYPGVALRYRSALARPSIQSGVLAYESASQQGLAAQYVERRRAVGDGVVDQLRRLA